MRRAGTKPIDRSSVAEQEILKQLRTIPGVGKSIAVDLRELGVSSVGDLVDRDPEDLYESLCRLKGCRVDRCMLYVFRCAVYFASDSSHDPELLKWWNWKDNETIRSR